MEGEKVANKPSEKVTLGEELVALCKYYMAMGVSWDEYWYGDYCKLKFYEANYYNQKELKNQELWLEGFYSYLAVSTSLSQMFNPQANARYPEKPIEFTAGKTKTAEEKQKEAMKRMQAQLEAQIQQWRAEHPDAKRNNS